MGLRRALIGPLTTTLLAAAVVLVAASPASAAPVVKPGFNVTKSTQPNVGPLTNFMFVPGTAGTMLATSKCGGIGRGTIDGGWSPVSWTPLATVYCSGDRGLLGIDMDPGTTTVYLLYDYVGIDGKVYGRLSKTTADSASAPSSLTGETPILDNLPSYSADVPGTGDDSHTIGTVLVAPDHSVFVGVGDGSSYLQPDVSATNAQDIDSVRGKIFHIDGNGQGLTTNPFYRGDVNEVRAKVYAYGLRNPFRFTLKPDTDDTLYIGDVGWNTWEEIDVATGGEDFGWPCWEGSLNAPPNTYQSLAFCQTQRANPPANLKGPLYWWDHSNNGNAAVGGAFAVGAQYGAYSGAFFFGDFAWNKLWAFQQPGPSGLLLGDCSGDAFGCDVGDVVAIHQGPNSDIYYADITANRISELRYDPGSNQPPVVHAVVDPAASTDLSTNFRFDASASFDTEGDPLTFAWTFGDGSTAAGMVVTHNYDHHDDFNATVTVSDSHGGVSSLTLPVSTNHSVPRLTITPDKSGPYAVGDTVTMTAMAKDETNQAITGAGITWDLQLHHCPAGVGTGQCHIHPQAGGSGTTFSVTVPDHGDDMYLEFRATAIDSNGYSTTKSLNLPMDEHSISVSSNVPGVPIDLNTGAPSAPFTGKAVTNSVNRLSAPMAFGGSTFLRWSDGVTDPVRIFTMPAGDVSFTAEYSPAGRFTPVSPYRLFDTRSSTINPNGANAPLEPGQVLALDLSAEPGRPAAANAVLLNVTATAPGAAGYVKAFPCGTEPYISTVNFDPGQTAANLAIVRLPADGRVCFSSLVTTHLVVDVSGWYAPGITGSPYAPVEPVRLLDTRATAPLAAGGELRLHLADVPADAAAALVNLTVTDPVAAGYVRAYPCGEEQDVSNVNYVAGQTVANLAAVKVAAGGDVCFRSYAPAQLVVDLAGWYGPEAAGGFVAADPQRLLDTRSTPGFTSLVAGQELAVPMTSGPIPADATAVAVNITATNTAADGYIAAYPCGTSPLVSDVNYRAGQVAAANLAVVKLAPDGRLCFTSFATTDLVVDLAGWYVD
jgi:glucose/arabinose dehydrogenase